MAHENWWSKTSIIMLFILAWLIWNFWAANWTPPWDVYGNIDFFVFYTAGKAWLANMNPYPQIPVYGRPEFFYPPTSLLLFGLYAMFSFDAAKDLWFVTYMSVFAVAAIACTFMLRGERKRWYVLLALLLIFASYPLQNQMLTGQSDLLMASLTVLSLVCQRSKHDNVSAFLLASATLLKGPAILLLIYFVLYRHDIKYLLRFLLSTALIVGASLTVIPIQLYSYYLTNVAPNLLISAGEFHQSAVSYLAQAGVNYLSPIVSVAGVILFALFAFYVNSKKSSELDSDSFRDDTMFLMNILVYLLLGPQTSPYSYVWVILPLALVLSNLITQENVRFAYLALMGFETFLLSSNIYANFNLVVVGQIPYPVNVAGSLMMIVSLIPIFIRFSSITRSVK